MEDSLGLHPGLLGSLGYRVLILVVMEDSLGPTRGGDRNGADSHVLILVVMEDSLGPL